MLDEVNRVDQHGLGGLVGARGENAKLRQQVSLLAEVTAERDTLREELGLAQSRI